MAFDRVAGAQAETADLRGRDVNVVGAGEVVRFRRAQKAEAVGEDFDDAFADDVDFFLRELFEDREHQLLLAHGAGVFDFLFFREGEELDRSLDLEVLKFHFPHWGLVLLYGIRLSFNSKIWKAGTDRKKEERFDQILGSGRGHYGIGIPARCLRGPNTRNARLTESIRLRLVGWLNIRNKRRFRKGRAISTRSPVHFQNGLTIARITIRTIRAAGTSLIIL